MFLREAHTTVSALCQGDLEERHKVSLLKFTCTCAWVYVQLQAMYKSIYKVSHVQITRNVVLLFFVAITPRSLYKYHVLNNYSA